LAIYTPDIEGKYTFKANVFNHENKKSISVESSNLTEEYDLKINEELLKNIADSTKGIFLFSDEFSIDKIIEIIKKETKPIVSKYISLYTSPVAYFVVLFLLLLEWIIRRIKGSMW
ncbi:MAG: hypothetical protein ACK4JE_05785, partial [Endomicrobiia bacterium]